MPYELDGLMLSIAYPNDGPSSYGFASCVAEAVSDATTVTGHALIEDDGIDCIFPPDTLVAGDWWVQVRAGADEASALTLHNEKYRIKRNIRSDSAPAGEVVPPSPANAIKLTNFLHSDDRAAIISGDYAAQDATRVTQSIRSFHLAALQAMFANDGAQVVAEYMPGIYAVNDKLMSFAFHNLLWETTGYTRSRIRFVAPGPVTFKLTGWLRGRAEMRTGGIFEDTTVISPNAVWEWYQPTGYLRFGGMEGQIIIEGENNIATDPIGFYFYRLNGTRIEGMIETRNLLNRSAVFDSCFNSEAEYVRAGNAAGAMMTEAGGAGLLTRDTKVGTVTTGLRYTLSGATITINTMTYDIAAGTYGFVAANVFTADHVGKWIALERQGRDNDIGEGSEDGSEGGAPRRSADWFQISSVTNGSTAVLASAPPQQGTTGQMAAQNRTFSFGVLKCSISAGSNTATLSMPITTSLVGFDVIIPSAHYDGLPAGAPNLVAMVTAHTGNSVTLSHAAGVTVSGVPFVVAPQVHIGRMSHTQLMDTSRKTDDMHFGRLWCESANSPGLPLFVQDSTNLTLGDQSKLHGTSPGSANFGANFACLLAGEIGGRFKGRYTHSRHSREFGMFYLAGDRNELYLDGELSSWTPDNKSAMFYLAPANVATIRIQDTYFNASDYARGFPDAAAGQVFVRGNANLTGDMVKSGASQRNPSGERPIWPPTALPPTRAPAFGSTRADAVSAISRGGWLPANGVVYRIEGRDYLGQTGATEIADLPGLVAYGHGNSLSVASLTVAARHHGAYFTLNAGATVTLPALASVWEGFAITLSAGTGNTSVATITLNGADTIQRDALIYPGERVTLVRMATGWHRHQWDQGWDVNAGLLLNLDSTATPPGHWRVTSSTTQTNKPAHYTASNLMVEIIHRATDDVLQRIWQPGNPALGMFCRVSTGANTWSDWRNGGDVPALTTAQRDAFTNRATGVQIFNTTTTLPNWWSGAAWIVA